MKTFFRQVGIISTNLMVLLFVIALIGIAMSFSILWSAQPRVQQAKAATCGCNPPPDTHGWTDNMCFFPPSTDGCPQTFPGGYCDPNKDQSFEDADWTKGYYEYRTLCPGSPTGGVVPTNGPGGGTATPTSPVESTPTAVPTQKPLDLNECIGFDVYAQAEEVRKLAGNELAEKLLDKYRQICQGKNQAQSPTPVVTGGAVLSITPGTGGTNAGFPSSLSEFFSSTKVTAEAMQYVGNAQQCAQNMPMYINAAKQAGIPENLAAILAGIHFIEGSCNLNQSLRNGYKIGQVDTQGGLNCSSQDTGPGKPIPIGGGCGFATVEDSAIWAAKHFVGKNGVPEKLEDLIYSYGLYNGTGNNNCGKYSYILNGKYSWCPEKFDGEAHPYGMNLMGALFPEYKDRQWYVLFCKDGVLCSDPQPYQRPNAAMIALLAWRKFNNAL